LGGGGGKFYRDFRNGMGQKKRSPVTAYKKKNNLRETGRGQIWPKKHKEKMEKSIYCFDSTYTTGEKGKKNREERKIEKGHTSKKLIKRLQVTTR